MIEHSAGVILFRNTPEGRRYLVLLSSRKESTIAKGKIVREFWDFPKGRLEKGETNVEAAEREAFEEAGARGIKILKGFRETIRYVTWRNGKPTPKSVAMFLAEAPLDSKITLSWEHDAYEWFAYREAHKRLLRETSIALEKAEGFLQTTT